MRLKMSKFVCAGLSAALLVGSITGCSSKEVTKEKDPQTTDATTKEEGELEKSNESEVADGEAETISFIHWRSEDADVYKKIIANFEEENPNIKVNMEITTADQNEYYALIKARLSGSEGLDVFAIHPGFNLLDFQKAGKLEDLTDLPFVANYEPSLVDSCKVDDKVYGLVQAYNTQGVFYNKDIFAKYELEVPKTWDDMVNVCKVLKENGEQTIASGSAEDWVHNIPFIQTVSAYFPEDPTILHKLETGEAKLTDDQFKKVFQAYQDMAVNGFFMDGAMGTKYEPSITLFAQGQAAMLNTGTWSVGGLKQQDENLNFGYFFIPTPEGAPIAQTGPAQAISLSKDSKHKDASIKFLEYLSTVEAATLYANATTQNSAIMGVTLDMPEMNEVADLIASTEKSYACYHLVIENTKVSDICLKTMVQAFNGQDIDTITEAAQKEIEVALAE